MKFRKASKCTTHLDQGIHNPLGSFLLPTRHWIHIFCPPYSSTSPFRFRPPARSPHVDDVLAEVHRFTGFLFWAQSLRLWFQCSCIPNTCGKLDGFQSGDFIFDLLWSTVILFSQHIILNIVHVSQSLGISSAIVAPGPFHDQEEAFPSSNAEKV